LIWVNLSSRNTFPGLAYVREEYFVEIPLIHGWFKAD
jgi:hypothetical protein